MLPRQSWIDRIVRGRAWIPVFGALLVAIVGMRVEVLKLSSRVGTQISQASELQSSNALLRSAVSGLSGTERIEALAERLGMVMPGPMDIHFVPASDGDHVQAAIRAIHAPEPDSFLTGLADERQADQTSLQAAAETSAVGVLANTVPGYGQSAGDGIASDPVVGPLSTTGSLSSTTGAGSAAPASTAATGADAAASGTAASATSTATGTQSGSSAGTVTPSQSAAQAPSTTSSSSPTSGLGGGASDPPTSSGTATLAGSQSGSTSGGTSLSG